MSAQHPLSGAWRSTYRQEIQDIFIECKVGNVLKNNKSPKYNVTKAVDEYTKEKANATLKEHRSHSLKYLPEYPDQMGRQKYLGKLLIFIHLGKIQTRKCQSRQQGITTDTYLPMLPSRPQQ